MSAWDAWENVDTTNGGSDNWETLANPGSSNSSQPMHTNTSRPKILQRDFEEKSYKQQQYNHDVQQFKLAGPSQTQQLAKKMLDSVDQPQQIRLLKRPDSAGQNRNRRSPTTETKTQAEREKDYANIRARIMGADDQGTSASPNTTGGDKPPTKQIYNNGNARSRNSNQNQPTFAPRNVNSPHNHSKNAGKNSGKSNANNVERQPAGPGMAGPGTQTAKGFSRTRTSQM